MESIYRSSQDEETLYMTGTRTTFTRGQIKESYKEKLQSVGVLFIPH